MANKSLSVDDEVLVAPIDLNEDFSKYYRRLNKIRIDILRANNKFAFYGGFLLLGNTFIDRLRFPTAATDGFNIWYNPEFMDTLTDKELAFVVLHEVSHIMFKHMYIWKHLFVEDQKKANHAADYVINYILVQLDPNKEVISMPSAGLYSDKYAGMSTKQIYDLLTPEDMNGSGEGGDVHVIPDGNELSEDFKKELDNAIKVAKSKPNNPFSREFGDLDSPQEKWEDKLREYALNCVTGSKDSTWRKPNRRFLGEDILMPSMSSDEIPIIVNAIDTSGSIGVAELTKEMNEVCGIMNDVEFSNLHLLYWDDSVAGHEIYNSSNYQNFINETKPKGYGGTDVKVVFEYLKKKEITPNVCIIMTDGYTDFPKEVPEYPVIFVITTDITPPFGKIVRIKV